MKFSLSFFIDLVFSTLIGFLLFLIIVNCFLEKPYSLVMSISLSLILAVFVFRYLKIKHKKFCAKKYDQALYESAVMQFNLMTKLELISFFESSLQKLNVLAERKHGGIFIKEKNVYLFFKFSFEQVNKADIVRVFNSKEKDAKAYLLAENFSEDIKAFAKRFDNVYLCDAFEVFTYLKEKQCLPENKYQLSQPKFNKIKALKSLFQRKKAKTFLLLGISFLFMSYFVIFKIYYLVCATIFLTLSLVCLLFGKRKGDANN